MDKTVIIAIVMAITFFLILLFNSRKKNKIINVSFQMFILLFLILLIIYDTDYTYLFLKNIINYFMYPDYVSFVSTIIITNGIMIFTFLKKDLNIKNQIVNYLLFVIIFFAYIAFKSLDIDVTLYNSVYSSQSLFYLRLATMSFSIWFVITLGIKYFKIVLKRGKEV